MKKEFSKNKGLGLTAMNYFKVTPPPKKKKKKKKKK